MPAEGFTYLPPHKPISLDNVTCPYCGRHFSDTTDATLERTTEHVISRRFVPKGTLNQQWNLIISAHRGCNGRKSDYEDDISAITMQPNVFGVHADDHELLAAEAIRKGKSVSRKTRRPVKDSSEAISFSAIMGPAATLKGNFACAPQVDERRAAELARMQAQAFFYFLTYKPDLRVGHFWRGQFIVVNMAPRLDAMSFVVRTTLTPEALTEPARRAIGEVDSNLALGQVRTLQDILDRAAAQMAFTMVLLAIAAGVSLTLGVVGIYGAMSYIVTQRTGEIGVRLALGAEPGSVARMIVGQGGIVALVGIMVGLVFAVAGGRLIESLLFGVSPRDPVVFAATTVVLLGVVFLACWLPARRAALLNPLDALRTE